MTEVRSNSRFEGDGLIEFQETQHAMQAEEVLKENGYAAKLVAPPLHRRRGCDLALEINLAQQPPIEGLLREKDVQYLSIVPLGKGSTELLDVVKATDFGDYVMVKVAHMKLTFDKKNGVVVNVSGGGCPDIPYLHLRLLHQKLRDAPRPKDIGFTLCALMLDRGLDESIALCEGKKDI